MRTVFEFDEVQNAFAQELISLQDFAQILADNFGKKKARKILRRNLDAHLKKENMSWEERQEHLFLVSLLV